ncbi:MAG: type III-B CRISPR module-associated protein Cmr3 [Gammaproteobacteria bacterium]
MSNKFHKKAEKNKGCTGVSPGERRLPQIQACAPHERLFEFHPFDTWFFRESRPFDALGGSELASLFPPPIRTLAGALRHFLGEQIDIDWKTLSNSLAEFTFKTELGDAENLGKLKLQGPWINFKGERLYPAPSYLLKKERDLQRLVVGNKVLCDLGHVRLPQLPELPADQSGGYQVMERYWLTTEGLRKCLEGKTPSWSNDITEIVAADQLFDTEPRLGIARDNRSRQVKTGFLYQTAHVRPHPDLHLELIAQNLRADLVQRLPNTQQPGLVRLGGEGRQAAILVHDRYPELPSPRAPATATVDSVALHFMTAADFQGESFPSEFTKTEIDGQTVWSGNINGMKLQIEAVVCGKAYREGGWDLQNRCPREVKSLVPAGSVWFCRLKQPCDWQTLLDKLHGHCIGQETEFGRGQILLGHWQDTHHSQGK